MEPRVFFYGKWIVEIISTHPGIKMSMGFYYLGDLGGGGRIMDLTPGTKQQFDQPYWAMSFSYSTNGTSWQDMRVRKTSVDFLPALGLVVMVGAARDQDFADLVVQCRNLDPQINAFAPITNGPDFSYPETAKIEFAR